MSMQTLIQFTNVPPNGWRCPVPVPDGEMVKSGSWLGLVANVRKKFFQLGLEIPNDLELIIGNWICSQLPEQDRQKRCYDVTPPTKTDLLKRAAGSLLNFASSGFALVDKETFVQRYETCRGCDRWNGDMIFGVGHCGACGCTGLKLYVREEHCPLGKWL